MTPNMPPSMNAIEAVLFDCDGVLLDSEPLGCDAIALAVTEAGIPMTLSEARQIFSGNSAQDSRDWMSKQGLDAEVVFPRADEILFDMFEHSIPHIPGIEAVLADFPLHMAVCSNAGVQRLSLSLCKTPLAQRFGTHIYSADQVARAKPAPDLALHACTAFGIAPQQALFIDDNIHGIHCAKSAGCVAVGFIAPSDDRENHAETLRAAGADYVVHGMAEFHTLLTILTAHSYEDA